ncbi:MAG: cell envelope integrity protein TolA [Gammaproteobacteria bacterium]|nr:cell envelope integrity protein TolA [Gammaproteobacteria bacterium]MDH5692179.1 cell envelope integrity protein TolA [Gammaproteobacteria bacterium]
MKAIYAKYPRAFLLAVLLHGVMLGMLVVSFDWTAKTPDMVPPEVNIVKATAVDEQAVQEELDKIKRAEERRENRVKKLERDADKAQKKREREQVELKKLEENRKKEQAAKKKAEQERAEVEADRKRAEVEAQRLKEEAQNALEAQQRLEMDEQRKRMLAEESQRLEDQQTRKLIAEKVKYTALIKQKIESKWIQPLNAKVGMRCTINISIIPSGRVISFKIVRSSGDKLFDRSVESAVNKSSPLPIPNDPRLASEFRNIDLEFKKE